jgi:hypothetical protein
MGSRNDAFASDPESSSVLKSLGYSEEEISGTPGEATPDDLRTSLRQLSDAHSSAVQREHMPPIPPNPKYEKQVGTPSSDDYWQGRKDEAIARKDNMNPGGGGTPKPRATPKAAAKPKSNQTMKQVGKILKAFGGSGKSASKTLGGVTRAQRGRR